MINDEPGWYRNIISRLNGVRFDSQLEPVLLDILPEVISLLGAHRGVIRIETGDRKVDICAEASSGGASLCFTGLAPPDCVCARAINRAGGVLVCHDPSPNLPCAVEGCGSVIVGGIPVDGVGKGLFFAVCDGKTDPAQKALNLAGAVCADIGGVVGRLKQARGDRQRARDMKTVNTIGGLITSKLTLKEMAPEIVSRLGQVLETDEVNVIVYDEARRELSFLASYFADGSGLDRPEVYPLSDGMNSWIIRNRRPLLMSHDTVAECARLGIRHGGRPARSWLGAPMIYKEKVVGVLSVQSYSKTRLYDGDSVTLIRAVANQCAVAVENARLFAELMEREEEKERLYFSLTHDLLSLINPVSGFARILKSSKPETPRGELDILAGHIINAATKITRFAEDILVYAKIKSGKLALDISRREVVAALAPALEVFAPEFRLRGIAVFVNGVETGDGVWMETQSGVKADLDVAQMERVFINLVGNAVKHARSKIEIEVQNSLQMVTCGVKDDGDGVASEEIDALFDEYYQSGGRKKGVGLGLPSVKKIIELHNGTIRIISGADAGFQVSFSWPRTLADRRSGEQAEQSVI